MEDNFKGIKFCPNCSNMLNATEEDKTLVFRCRYCKHTEEVGEQAEAGDLVIVRRQHKRKENRTVHIKDNQYLALDASMSRCQMQCQQCGYHECVFYITSDQNDTKILKVYVCARLDQTGQPMCGFTWNSDQRQE